MFIVTNLSTWAGIVDKFEKLFCKFYIFRKEKRPSSYNQKKKAK